MKEYFFDTDEDGHWYIIPLERFEEWNEWFDSDAYRDGITPDFVQRIDHPRNFAFQSFRDTVGD